jgi:iron complex transport system ATP-binding protein
MINSVVPESEGQGPKLSAGTAPVPDSMPTSWAGALVEVRGLAVRRGRRTVIDGLDLNIEPGRWTAVIGPNGAGKSTLLKAMAGVVKHEGAVLLDGGDVNSLSTKERARLIGYAPQVPTLPEGMRVSEYVLLGRTPHHSLLAGPKQADRAIVDRTLRRLDLVDVHNRPLKTLSGGERQRVVLARAIAQQPRLLLLDEPTAALDLGHAQQVLELVDELRTEDGLTVISTLHDLSLAGQYADELVLLGAGSVAAKGRPAQVLTSFVLAEHYGANAEVEVGPDGAVRVFPVRVTR